MNNVKIRIVTQSHLNYDTIVLLPSTGTAFNAFLFNSWETRWPNDLSGGVWIEWVLWSTFLSKLVLGPHFTSLQIERIRFDHFSST